MIGLRIATVMVTNEADRSPEDQFGVEVVLLRWTGETVVFQTSSSSRYPSTVGSRSRI